MDVFRPGRDGRAVMGIAPALRRAGRVTSCSNPGEDLELSIWVTRVILPLLNLPCCGRAAPPDCADDRGADPGSFPTCFRALTSSSVTLLPFLGSNTPIGALSAPLSLASFLEGAAAS